MQDGRSGEAKEDTVSSFEGGTENGTVPLAAEEWLSLDAAASSVGKSAKTVRRWITSGRLRAELHPTANGPAYRVRAADLDEALRAISVPPVAPMPGRAAIVSALREVMAERDAALLGEVRALREVAQRQADELVALRQEIATLRALPMHVGETVSPTSGPESAPAPGGESPAADGERSESRSETRRPSWWRRLLGG